MSAEPAQSPGRKLVSVVFSDLTNFTGLSEARDQEALSAIMARYFDEMSAVLTHHGGSIEKYIGDAVMAVFGFPVVHEDDALRAVRSAHEMRVRLEELNDELDSAWGVRLQARTGVNTGEVVAGVRPTMQPVLVADCVNVAARLQQAGRPGDILIGERTWRQVRRAVQADPVGPLDLKGKSGSVTAFRLRQVIGDSMLPGEGSVSLVGRDAELARLHEWFDQAVAARAARLATIVGDAGVGKSRLAFEFGRRLGQHATTLHGRCLSYGEGNTFWPLAEILRSAAGITPDDPAGEGIEKLARLGDGIGREVVEHVASAIGLQSQSVGLDETFWAARVLFEKMADRRPLVLVFDDLHWAEPALLDFIQHVIDCTGDGPIMVIGLTRRELLDVRPSWATTDDVRTRLELAPLGPRDSDRLVARLMADAEIKPSGLERIRTAAGGNPLFVEKLVEMLLDDGRLEVHDERWEPADTSTLTLPPTVDALLAARLDSLDAGNRKVLERAAVIGSSFSRTTLAALSAEMSSADLQLALSALTEGGFIRPDEASQGDGDNLQFAHLLLLEAAYGAMLKEERAVLHVKVARELERRAGERVAEYQEILGHHLERAYRYEESLHRLCDDDRALAREAAGWLAAGGRRALARGDVRAAAKLLERALSLVPSNDATRSDLLLRLSIAYAEMGDHALADELVSERIAAEHRGRPFIAYRDSAGKQRVFDLDDAETPVTVGRRSDSDIPIEWDGEVSRHHARFERGRSGWAVVDDGMSRNGSFLNGSRVSGTQLLEDGDVLRFGDTMMLYRAPPQASGEAGIAGSRATTLATLSRIPILSEPEFELLGALCHSWDQASGRSEERARRVESEMELGGGDSSQVLDALFVKLRVERATQAQELAQLVGRARGLGLVGDSRAASTG